MELPSDELSAIIASSALAGRVTSVEPFKGNLSFRSVLVRSHSEDFVLLRSGGSRRTIAKELAVIEALQRILPVPAILDCDADGRRTGHPFLIYQYVVGMTFEELRKRKCKKEISEAAGSIGSELGKLSTFKQTEISLKTLGLTGRSRLSESDLDFIETQGWLKEDFDLLRSLLAMWDARLTEVYAGTSLVHGDFNNRNTILHAHGGCWSVKGIIDWEHAFIGSPLWDVARFVCYEQQHSPCREPYFSNGFAGAGGHLPSDWKELSAMLNLVHAVQALCRKDLPPSAIREFRKLARTGIYTLVE
jgi:fructokinase